MQYLFSIFLKIFSLFLSIFRPPESHGTQPSILSKIRYPPPGNFRKKRRKSGKILDGEKIICYTKMEYNSRKKTRLKRQKEGQK